MTDAFDGFWEASSLHDANAPAFVREVQDWVPRAEPRRLTCAGPDLALPAPRDRLTRVIRERRSVRRFADRALTCAEVGGLLSAFGSNRHGGRAFPSAGALYPLEAICLMARVEGIERGAAVYNPDNHSLSRLADLPPWSAWRDALGGDGEDEPPLVVVFAIDCSLMADKYGERGGRFALIEVGHAAQNLALRIAEQRLAGYELGATLDDALLAVCDLGPPWRAALGYACGAP